MAFDTIFLIGPQGSGKGTQARILAEKNDMFYWEMGGVLRTLAKEPTELGKKLDELMSQGVLLTDELLLSVFKDRMSSIPADKGILFDGIPRRLGQAEFVLDFLKEQGRTNLATLFIDIPHEDSVNRLLLRAEKENRKDDTREAIEFRLQQYEADTIPVLDYLKERTQFFTIDGRPAVTEVTEAIDQALEAHAA